MGWIDVSAFKQNRALLYLLIGRCLEAFGFGIALFLIVVLAYEQTGSVTYAGLAVSVYQVVMVVLQPPMGRVADRYGRKRLILLGTAIHAVATFLLGASTSIFILLALRALQGLGASLEGPASQALVADLVPYERRGSLMGQYSTMINLGWFVGPVVGGLIADAFGTRAPFFICSVLVALSFFPIALYVKEPPRAATGRSNVSGPLTAKVRNVLLYLCLAYFLIQFSGSVMFPLIRVYMVKIEASDTEIGLVVAAFGLISAPLQAPFGRLSDRRGRKPLITLGVFSTSLVAPWYGFATSFPQLLLIRSAHGVASAMSGPVVGALVADVTPRWQRARALGMLSTAQSLGMVVGPLVGGALADLYGYQFPFLLCSGIMAVSALIIHKGVREPSKEEREL
ncbi:MAG: MFS transporter [Candidatus Bathyarchaeia archaeon]